MNKILLTCFLIICIIINGFTQNAFIQKINEKSSSIISLFTDTEKIKIGNEILNLLSAWLSESESFSSLERPKHIGRITSPDKQFKIYTFNIPLVDGTHLFYGVIQFKPKNGKCRIILLKDNSKLYPERPVFEQFTADNWYGSLYYEIIPYHKVKEKKIYVLLGSCLNNTLFTNKKIIESLWFNEDDLPIFGYPIFDYGLKVQNRIIFEYSIMAQMSIHYNKKQKMIIFDHLAPSSPLYINNFKYYGPDASIDGLKFQDGLWRFWSNVNPYKF